MPEKNSIRRAYSQVGSRLGIEHLRLRHSEPWRRYHDWAHPLGMLSSISDAIDAGEVELSDPLACAAFCVYHDSVYDPQARHGRNEALSAALFVSEATGILSAATVEAARISILATISHDFGDAEPPADGRLLLDVDLSILASDEERFARYEDGIRFEYGHVPEADYLAGRLAVMERFRRRERIFHTDWAHGRWEGAAKSNLERRCAELRQAIGEAASG